MADIFVTIADAQPIQVNVSQSQPINVRLADVVQVGDIAATVSVGTTTTSAAGTNALVSNSGSSTVAVLEFTIPRGDKGEQGDTGLTGVAGADGTNGTNGVDGLTGPTGAKGDQGIQGIKGDTGLKGDTGSKGDKGDAGAKGDTGATGAIGPKGDTGEQGIQGVPGSDTGSNERVVATISSAVNLGAVAKTDYFYLLDTGALPTMPTAIANTNRYTLKNTGNANITLATTSSQTIDGTTTISIPPENSVDLISNNSNWSIV